MAAKSTAEDIQTPKQKTETPYLLDADGLPKLNSHGQPIPNPRYSLRSDGELHDTTFKTATLVNLRPSVNVLQGVVKRVFKDPQTGEETPMWVLTNRTLEARPGGIVENYPLWPTKRTAAGNPQTGWVVADPSAITADWPWPWTEDQIIDFWHSSISDSIFADMAEAYQQIFNDHRQKVTRYILERNNNIRAFIKKRSML